MDNIKPRTIPILLLLACTIVFGAHCTMKKSWANRKKPLVVAYQYGLSFAPVNLMRMRKMIEKAYDDDLTIEWKLMPSSQPMNEGIAAGDIDVAFMGVPPAINGIARGVPCRVFSGLSTQRVSLLANRERIRTLGDFVDGDKISVVAYGSMQHIALCMAAERELGDAHALDRFLVTMAMPDATQGLLAGALPAMVSSSTYYLKTIGKPGIHEVGGLESAFGNNTIIVGVATEELHKERHELYQAVVDATDAAINSIVNAPEDAAGLLCAEEGVTAEEMKALLLNPDSGFSAIPAGMESVAEFMYRTRMLERPVDDVGRLFFDELRNRMENR